MTPISRQEEKTSFFDDTAIAVRFRGRFYGVLSLHPQCVVIPAGAGGVSTLLASDEAALWLAGRPCFTCGKPLLCPDEREAVVQLRADLHLPDPGCPSDPLVLAAGAWSV